WITIRDSSAFGAHDLRVSDLQLLVGIWWNRKDARLKKIFARVLEQSRVALAPHDLVVDAPRFFACSDLTNQAPVAVPNRKLRNRCRLGNREEIGAFEREVGGVAEDLFDVRGGHLRANLRVDLDRLDRQRPREVHRPLDWRPRTTLARARNNH